MDINKLKALKGELEGNQPFARFLDLLIDSMIEEKETELDNETEVFNETEDNTE